MRDHPRPSNLLVMIAVTAVIAAAAVGSTSAVREGFGASGRQSEACPPRVSERHYAVSLDLRCARGSDRSADRPPRKARS